MKRLHQTIERLSQNNVTVGLAIYHPASGRTFYCNEHRSFAMASVAKLIVSLAATHLSAKADGVDHVPGFSDLVRRAISHHDRSAADLLCELAGGQDSVNQWLASLRIGPIRIDRDNRRRDTNRATPSAILEMLRMLIEGRLVPEPAQSMIVEALREQTDPDGLLVGLPGGIQWLHMTGGLDGVCNDVGMISGPDSYVLCCAMVEAAPNTAWSELVGHLGEIGRLIDAWCRGNEA